MSRAAGARPAERARLVRSILLVALATGAGCGEPAAEPPTDPGTAPTPSTPAGRPARIHERSFVFLSATTDSLLIVPWILTARTGTRPEADSVRREGRGWVARGGQWEAFYSEAWISAPTRTPSRIVPHGGLGIVVRDGDVVDGLLFQEGQRDLELAMTDVVAAWVAPGGETFDVTRGDAYLSDQQIEGMVLELTRSWEAGAPPPGDWAFLTSGDSVHVVLSGAGEHQPDNAPRYRGWAQRGSLDMVWTQLSVAWADRQAFPPARRDVPTAWTVTSPDGALTGSLAGTSSYFEAGPGPGPLLPVLGLIEVAGVLATDGVRLPVRGIWVHRRR